MSRNLSTFPLDKSVFLSFSKWNDPTLSLKELTMLERSDLELETVFSHPSLEGSRGYSKSYDGNLKTLMVGRFPENTLGAE